MLQTGGKQSAVHLLPVLLRAGKEDQHIESCVSNFYYLKKEYLISHEKGQKWRCNVIRPEAIECYTSKQNMVNELLTIALCGIGYLRGMGLRVRGQRPLGDLGVSGLGISAHV